MHTAHALQKTKPPTFFKPSHLSGLTSSLKVSFSQEISSTNIGTEAENRQNYLAPLEKARYTHLLKLIQFKKSSLIKVIEEVCAG